MTSSYPSLLQAAPAVTVSIVSHGQGNQVAALLDDLGRLQLDVDLIVTVNVPEPRPAVPQSLATRTRWLANASPRGFAANHNAAFRQCATPFFCVVNPDIRLHGDAFALLASHLSDPKIGVVGPAVLDVNGQIEDSVRRFPTLGGLAVKLLGQNDGRYSFGLGDKPFDADWIGGMFMLFRSSAFAAVGGFNEKFFLYYEDVDICARLWKAGYRVLACPSVSVVHDAQRTSRHDWRYRRWHAQSMLRYFAKHWLRLPRPSGPD